MLELIFFSKLDLGFYIIPTDNRASKKLEALVCSMKFLLMRLLCISINLPYAHVWNTVVMSRLVLLVVTCCYLYKLEKQVSMTVTLHLPWLIAEMWPA